jgi:Tol biopolymer transport system component
MTSCSTQSESEQGIGSPQLTKDDKVIYFQYFDGLRGSICRMSINDSIFEQITPLKSEFTFYHPRLTEDERRIVFVGRNSDLNLNSIFIANSDGSNTKRLFSEKYVYDAFLSRNKNEIIYCKPDTFANYSPIARKGLHGYDIFSFNLDSNKISKLTNLHSYEIDGVSDYKKDSLLYTDEDSLGLYAISRNNPTKPRLIVKTNESDKMQNLFVSPVYVEKYNIIVFSNSYELCILNANKQIKRIYLSDKMVGQFCVFHNSPRLLFTLEGEFCLHSINLDGTNLKKIEVKLPERQVKNERNNNR